MHAESWERVDVEPIVSEVKPSLKLEKAEKLNTAGTRHAFATYLSGIRRDPLEQVLVMQHHSVIVDHQICFKAE